MVKVKAGSSIVARNGCNAHVEFEIACHSANQEVDDMISYLYSVLMRRKFDLRSTLAAFFRDCIS